jgi:uncharacterized membrane protein YhaH (DUF805 family)
VRVYGGGIGSTFRIELLLGWCDQIAWGVRQAMGNPDSGKALIFSFKGRVSRGGYWNAVLAGVMVCFFSLNAWALALGEIFAIKVRSIEIELSDLFSLAPSIPVVATFSDAGSRDHLVSLLFNAGAWVVLAAGFWFLVSSSVQRLHDRDQSGWWIVLFVAGAVLSCLLSDRVDDSVLALVASIAGCSLGLGGAVDLFCLKGTIGANRFGADPLPRSDASAIPHAPWDQQSELEDVPHRLVAESADVHPRIKTVKSL